MATGEPLAPSSERVQAVRAAGLQTGGDLTLSDVNKRRTQLWTISILFIAVIVLGIAMLSIGQSWLPDSFGGANLPRWVLGVLAAGLALAFIIYIVEKEMNLRRVAAMLVEERVLSSGLSHRLSEISELSELGKAVNATLDLGNVLSLILSSALEFLEGDEGAIMLLDEETNLLEVVSYHGPNPALMGSKCAIGQGLAGAAARDRQPILTEGPRRQPDAPPPPPPPAMQGEPGLSTSAGTSGNGYSAATGPGDVALNAVVPVSSFLVRAPAASMAVPLIRRTELLGVLTINEIRGERQWNEDDLRALGFFAEHAAIAIGNARLFSRERETVTRLRELDRLKSDFVATVTHELKTPLATIIGSAKTLIRKRSVMPPEKQLSFTQMIERQGARLLRLVEDILTTGRIESGRQRLRFERVDLQQSAELVLEELHQSPVGRSRTIELIVEPEHPTVWADMTSVQRILINLTENALKYSDDKVTVTITATDDEAVIRVADKGSGIPAEDLVNIFDRFRQVDGSSAPRAAGFGLGLFIVKSLVDAHNGQVDIESQEGVGTTFTVRLPRAQSEVQEGQISASR